MNLLFSLFCNLMASSELRFVFNSGFFVFNGLLIVLFIIFVICFVILLLWIMYDGMLCFLVDILILSCVLF